MREIKFRAWDKINEFMGEVLRIDFEEETVFCTTKFIDDSNKFSFEEVEFLQYTGLKDKNGREIYEGDLVSTDLSRPYNIVVFRNGAFMYQCHDSGQTYYDIMLPMSNVNYNNDEYVEIIGNIYENPELLEVNNADK